MQSEADQAEMTAREMARPFVALYNGLKDGGLDEHTASQLVLMYGRQVMASSGGQSG